MHLLADSFLVALASQLAAGLRIALVVFAAMVWLNGGATFPGISAAAAEEARHLNARAWSRIALAALSYSPIHTFWLRGHPLPPLVSRLADVAASGLACAAFILVLASRARARGHDQARVRKGMRASWGVAMLVVLATWVTR